MSDEKLPCSPEDWARRVLERYPALSCAQIFAAYKVGVAGAAQGFLEAAALQALCDQHQTGNRSL